MENTKQVETKQVQVQNSVQAACQTEEFLRKHFQFRHNVMTGVVEFRENRSENNAFYPLSQRQQNAMTLMALRAGIGAWDKDVRRYVNSTLVADYEPLRDYLESLPRWDGRERVERLARRIRTANKHWPVDFHRWMLAMVAAWLQMDGEHGNGIVPVLVGVQGSGKTTFCRRLLPERLQTYYNDRINLRNENDINLALSGFALINIDEFDSTSRSLQPLLKYLLTKHDVKMRPPFGKVMEQRKRYASFIATTNCERPLTDPTGSRRFICVRADQVNNHLKVNHAQVYAQLLNELREKQYRYWFTKKEEQRLMRANEPFRRISTYEELVRCALRPAEECADAPWMPLSQAVTVLLPHYPELLSAKSAPQRLGCTLLSMGYAHRRTGKGAEYKLVVRE